MALTEPAIIDLLKNAIREAGSLRAFARMHDFAPAFISFVVNGRAQVSDRLAECLGYTRITTITGGRRESVYTLSGGNDSGMSWRGRRRGDG